MSNECKHLNRKILEGGTVACANPDCDVLFPHLSILTEKKEETVRNIPGISETRLIKMNHHCPAICESDNLSLVGNGEKDGHFEIADLFIGERLYLNAKFCLFCGERIKAMEMPNNISMKEFHERYDHYKKVIMLESAPKEEIAPTPTEE